MLGRALTYLVLYSTLGMMFRWSWGVKLLSQADDEVEDIKEVPSVLPQRTEPESYDAPGTTVQSPEQMPHPGGRETDPFFSSQDAMANDEREESRNPSRSLSAASRGRRSADNTRQADFQGIDSAHSLHPTHRPVEAVRRQSTTNNKTRSQSQSSMHRRPITRTESGREFWGLPQFPKRERILLEEDSSDDDIDEEDEPEEDAEWVCPSCSVVVVSVCSVSGN